MTVIDRISHLNEQRISVWVKVHERMQEEEKRRDKRHPE